MSTHLGRATLVALGLSLLACSGLRGGTESGGVSSEIGAIEGTQLDVGQSAIPTLAFDEGTSTEIDDGDGVQILQISPVGPDRKALQVAVLFDRPMVPITDLESMNQSVPLECRDGSTPPRDLAVKARWAGTSTAVLLPEKGSFPLATHYDCTVKAGTAALDGETLEKEVKWSFETPRPHVVQATPRDGADQVDPKEPIELVFDQDVEPDAVEGHVFLKDSEGLPIPFEARRSNGDTRIALDAKLQPDVEYTVEVTEGVVGAEGPLASNVRFVRSFRTYPPLTIVEANPSGTTSPSTWISLVFSTPVAQSEVSKRLSISPTPDGWEPPDGDWEWSQYRYGVPFAPNTTYTVKLAGDLTDVHGQKLGEGYEWKFETGDYDPWLTTPNGLAVYSANNPPELPFKHLNASRIDAVAASFDPNTLTHPEDWASLAEARLRDPASRKVFEVAVDPTANRTELDGVDLTPLLGQSGFGWVATQFSAPNVLGWDGKVHPEQGMMIVTDLGGTLKIGPRSTEVWVTSLATGQPVEGVDVDLFLDKESAGRARTDASGLARIDGVPGPGWSRWEHDVWARLKKGGDNAIVWQNWDDGLEPWSFGVYGGFESQQRVVAHGFADRGVYRLGDPVYARSTFRIPSGNGLEMAVAEVHWTLTDPSGTEYASGDGSLDARGGLSVQTALPPSGMLGDWTLSFLAAGNGWTGGSAVPVPARAYRPPAFRVEVAAPAVAYAGQEIRVTGDARYLFGAPLKNGEVHWRAWTEDSYFQPEGLEEWSVRPEVRWWDEEAEEAPSTLGDQVLPLNGVSTFAQKIESGYRNVAVKLFVEAEVTDVDRQAIANRSETLVHPAAYYIGVRSKTRLPKFGEKVEVEVLAVDPDGTPRPETVEVTVVRREWNSVREKGMDGQWRWVNTPVDEEVLKEDVVTGAEPKSVSFEPTKAGYYVMSARGKDSLGNKVLAEDGLYVLGAGYVGWGRSDDNHIELVPEKKTWRPGDTARILVKSPAEKLNALVTVEREGVLWRKVVTLAGAASTVEIPITDAYRPNVYVSVVAVEGAGPQDAPDKGRPSVFAGMIELTVDATDEHLAVEVTPSAELYRPRDTVEVEVSVARAGKPVADAGVTLYAVDESILSLTAYKTPDAFGTFYEKRPLSVFTADSRTAALDRAAYLTKGANRGGGGGLEEAGPEVRSKFVTTVTWQPDLHTGPDGKVKAKFELPDNLTAFRIMAIADAGPVSFGSGAKEIRVSRPLMLRPAMPRILRTGDQAYAGVVVHNDVDEERWVKVTAEVGEGGLELTGSPVELKIPAGTSVEVPFGLRALEQGTAKITFTATSGEDRDGLEWTLPIEREVLLDTVATAGAIEGSVTDRVARPDDAFTTFGGLDVNLATTALVGVGTGLGYLQAYPHECLEQRTSRALGDLMALRVRERAGLTMAEDVLRKDVQQVLGELPRYRVSGGGLGYWSGSSRSSMLASAYALELMARAKADGFVVDPALFDDTVRYLRDAIAGRVSTGEWSGDPALSLVARSTVALALARAGAGDVGLENELFGKRKELSVFGTASLLEAIVLTSGPDARTAELEKSIASRSFIEAAGASVKENDTGRWARLWGSDDLSTAAALEALLAGGRENPLAPRYALHLASSKVGDRWANTRATAGVLAALADYAEKYEGEVGGTVQASVMLAGESLLKEALKIPATTAVHLPMDKVQNGDLVIAGEGGQLYYETRLVYAPRDPAARDEGFTISRTLEWLDGAGKSGAVEAGATMRVNLTVVTPVVRHNVAVVDRIPAGFEALDASLATASQAPSGDAEDLGYAEPETIEDRMDELPEFGGSPAFDHHEIDDAEVRLYAEYMPPGVHTYRYVVRATSPGTYTHPPATVEEMYEPENFGRTKGGKIVIGGAQPPKP